MRKAWPALTLALFVALIVTFACKSTQPDRQETRRASLAFSTLATVNLYDCYEIWVETDPNNNITPDLDTGYIQCFQAPLDQGNGFKRAQRAVPWRYSLAISVIHEGQTTEEPVTSVSGLPGSSIAPSDGIDDFVSLTNYDLGSATGRIRTSPDQSGNYFVDPKEVSEGSPLYLASLQLDLGVPNILQTTPKFEFDVISGDTVIVRGRKQAVADAPAFIDFGQDPAIELNATLAINGVTVSPNPADGATSSSADKAGVSFSFTVR